MLTRSRIRHLFVALIATVACDLSYLQSSSAQGTLMRWNSDLAQEGGPNLDEPLVTDRPDFTEASVTVGRGVIQVESGYSYFFDNDGTDQTIVQTYPESLFRIGLFADWFEARVAYNYASEQINGIDNSGSEDLYMGAKLAITGQAGLLPEMAIVPQMTVPTGDDSLSADETQPGVNFLYSWGVNDFISTAGSTQFNRALDEAVIDSYTEWAQSWTIGYSLLENWGAYTEWFAFFPHSASSAQTEHYFNGGVTFLITDNIQWDIRAGMGLNDAADDYFVGTGLSFRFLKFAR